MSLINTLVLDFDVYPIDLGKISFCALTLSHFICKSKCAAVNPNLPEGPKKLHWGIKNEVQLHHRRWVHMGKKLAACAATPK